MTKPNVEDLRGLVIGLARALRKAAPDSDLPNRALDYLRRAGIALNPLRASDYSEQYAGMDGTPYPRAPTQAPMQPSDEQIIALWPQFKKVESDRTIIDFLPFARAVLALAAPTQAVGERETFISESMRKGATASNAEIVADSMALAAPTQAAKAIGMKHRSPDGRTEFIWWGQMPPEGTYIYAAAAPAAAAEPTVGGEERRLVDGTPLGALLRWQEQRIKNLEWMVKNPEHVAAVEPTTVKLFKTTVLGIGPYCIEFPDGEIIHTRSEDRQKAIAAALAAPTQAAPAAAVEPCPTCEGVGTAHGMLDGEPHSEQCDDCNGTGKRAAAVPEGLTDRIDTIIRDVAELEGSDSGPDYMVVTADELRVILERNLATPDAKTAAVDGMTDAQIDAALEAWFANGPVGIEHKTDRTRMRCPDGVLTYSADQMNAYAKAYGLQCYLLAMERAAVPIDLSWLETSQFNLEERIAYLAGYEDSRRAIRALALQEKTNGRS